MLRVVLRTDGEMVLEAVPHLGYLHRCKEKIGENLPYIQYIGYTDRLDYLSAMNNNHAWSMAVEKLANIEVPPRAEYIRVLAVELNRVASHLVSFGTYGLDMGAFTPFLYAFREREYILDLFEQLLRCPAHAKLYQRRRRHLGPAAGLPGEADRVPRLFRAEDRRIQRPAELQPYLHQAHRQRRRVHQRTMHSLRPQRSYMIRGSGIPLDLPCRDRPYSIYDKLDFDICIGSGLVNQRHIG